MADIRCPACGSENPPHAAFCARCGKPVAAPPPEPIAAAPAQVSPSDPGRPIFGSDSPPPARPTPPLAALAAIAAGSMACMALILVAGWFFMGGTLNERGFDRLSRLFAAAAPAGSPTAILTPRPTATFTPAPSGSRTPTPTAPRAPASPSGTAVRTPTMTPDPSWTPPPLTLAKGVATVQPSADTIYSGVVLYDYLDGFSYEMMGRSDSCPKYASGKGVLYRYRDGVPRWEEEPYFMGWVTDPNKQYKIRADDAGLKAKQWKTYPGCP